MGGRGGGGRRARASLVVRGCARASLVLPHVARLAGGCPRLARLAAVCPRVARLADVSARASLVLRMCPARHSSCGFRSLEVWGRAHARRLRPSSRVGCPRTCRRRGAARTPGPRPSRFRAALARCPSRAHERRERTVDQRDGVACKDRRPSPLSGRTRRCADERDDAAALSDVRPRPRGLRSRRGAWSSGRRVVDTTAAKRTRAAPRRDADCANALCFVVCAFATPGSQVALGGAGDCGFGRGFGGSSASQNVRWCGVLA